MSTESVSERASEEAQREVDASIARYSSARFRGRRKLSLAGRGLTHHDLPLHRLCDSRIGSSLEKLRLDDNPLSIIPDTLVRALPRLKALSMSNCCIQELPQTWMLPELEKLDLSRNNIASFPDEASCVSRTPLLTVCRLSQAHLLLF